MEATQRYLLHDVPNHVHAPQNLAAINAKAEIASPKISSDLAPKDEVSK